MSTRPTVTVLMPVRDGARHLAAAVRSITRQTWRDFELLVVDDGSRDRTPRLLRKLARRDPRLVVLRREAQGVVAALNAGLALARGELIARMDADDLALPHRLERQVAYLRAHPDVVAVGGRMLVIDPEGMPLCVTEPAFTHDAIEAAIIRGGLGVGLAHPVVMARRQAMLAVGCYRARYETAEDADLWLRMGERGQLANLDELLLHYRLHPDSLSSRRHVEQARIKRAVVEEAARRRGWSADRLPPLHLPTRPRNRAELYRAWADMARGAGYLESAEKCERRRERARAWLQLQRTPTRIDAHKAMLRSLLGPQLVQVVRRARARLGASKDR